MELSLTLQAQQRFTDAPTMEALKILLQEQCGALGFHSFIYALREPTNFSNAQVILLDGYPDGWVKRYFEAAYYDCDPVMAWCIKQIVPLRWSDLVLASGSREARLMLEAAEHGLRDGVTVPVHGAQGELGIFSLSLDAPPEQARATIELALPYAQLMAVYLHQAVRRLSGLQPLGGAASLTPRERECLAWSADGKTSNDIAQLLGLSANTVNFHLNKAMQKLGVASRQHGIGKATLQRLIQPKPF
jgi:DNA-binding CsgD family transcriptional regulator